MKDKIKEILVDVYQIDGRHEDEAAERILRLFSVIKNEVAVCVHPFKYIMKEENGMFKCIHCGKDLDEQTVL